MHAYPSKHHTHFRYDYTVCPFDNITQIDVVSRWNGYKGVLGCVSLRQLLFFTYHEHLKVFTTTGRSWGLGLALCYTGTATAAGPGLARRVYV